MSNNQKKNKPLLVKVSRKQFSTNLKMSKKDENYNKIYDGPAKEENHIIYD